MSVYLVVVVFFGILSTVTVGAHPGLKWFRYNYAGGADDRVLDGKGSEQEDDYQDFDHQPWLNPHDLRTSPMFIEFLVRKGCNYLSGYVHAKFQHSHHSRHAELSSHGGSCDWTHWAMKRCTNGGMVPELCGALINCNASTALWALNAPDFMYQPCNISVYDSAPHASASLASSGELIGKRDISSALTGSLALETSATSDISVSSASDGGLYYSTDKHEAYPDWFVHIVSNTRSISPQMVRLLVNEYTTYYRTSYHGYTTEPNNNPNVDRYCRHFSRKLQSAFHFDHIPRTDWSKDWVTDVYKIAARAKMPPHMAHCLVGCGMTYARDTMNLKPKFSQLLSQHQ